MKACLGQKVKISLPKAYQTTNPKKSPVAKVVPAEITEQEFKEFLDLNKINYAKAEKLTIKKDGRVLEMFKLEIKDDTEAEALITESLTCPTTGIIGTAKISAIWPKLLGPKPNALFVVKAAIIKDAQTKRKSSHNAPVVKDHMLHPTKSVQHTKNRHLDNMW